MENNKTKKVYKLLRWSMIGKEINSYLAEIKADNNIKDLYRSLVDYATKDFGKGLLDEINLYDDISFNEEPLSFIEELMSTLKEYKKESIKDSAKVEKATVDFAYYYVHKNRDNFSSFIEVINMIEDVEKDEFPQLEEKSVKKEKITPDNADLEEMFETKKEIFLYKFRLNHGESLVDIIDEVLEKSNVAFVIKKDNKNNDSVESVHDLVFFQPINERKTKFKPIHNNNEIENKLLSVHIGYSLTINPINMDSSKDYSIVRTEPSLLNAFMALDSLSKAKKKELNFPKSR